MAFFVILSGVYLSFVLERQSIRHEVRTNIKNKVQKSELDLIVFHKLDLNKQVKWKHEEEFEWQGEMYDVIYTKSEGDSLYYWCWADHEESELNKEMQNWIAHIMHHSPNSKERNQTINHNYQNLFISYTDTIEAHSKNQRIGAICYTNSLWSYEQIPPALPPPEFIC